MRTRLSAALAALMLFSIGAPAAAQDEAATYVLTGFRSADFGMNEDQLRAAIEQDFDLSGDDVLAVENDIQRTKALIVQVQDLLPDTGLARVSYVMGYKSKALTQVAISWGGGLDEATDLRALVAMANQLRTHFVGQGYDPASLVANQRLSEAQTVIFRGRDAANRMTLLTLDAPPTPEGAEAPPRPAGLQLVYMENPETPDVFAIDQGAF